MLQHRVQHTLSFCDFREATLGGRTCCKGVPADGG